MCLCQPYDPATPPTLNAPRILAAGLCPAKFYGSYREAIRVAWSAPPTDSIGVRSYTLLRKTATDSSFDVFSRSQGIPPGIDTFRDDMTPIGFPAAGFSLVQYKAFATDSLGRPGDTSEPCSLYLARQPALDTFDQVSSCVRWRSSNIMGSVKTQCALWGAGGGTAWTSQELEDFGSENYPTIFEACLPDSLRPIQKGTWYYALFLFAMGDEHQSLTVDSFHVDK